MVSTLKWKGRETNSQIYTNTQQTAPKTDSAMAASLHHILRNVTETFALHVKTNFDFLVRNHFNYQNYIILTHNLRL